ncbi:MAG: ribonuclease III [Oscillospiraceae bacterium]|nr:ribonuclease III [Oscillospiraceae bacterium]
MSNSLKQKHTPSIDLLLQFQRSIGYIFYDDQLLIQALTHSSYMHEIGLSFCNERMEFLGDSLLSVIVAEHIYRNREELDEGDLTRLRADIVCEESLYEFAKSIDLGSYLFMSNGELRNGGDKRPSVLSDAFEALVAAIYLDGGMAEARRFVLSCFDIQQLQQPVNLDYKSQLQVDTQKMGMKIRYETVNESGPDHDKQFTVNVLCDDLILGTGTGKSKKAAEQQAAKNALELSI